MDKLPFSVYDFFGYLASGFVLLVGLAAAFVGNDDWQKSPTTIVGLLLIVLAYAAGHVVANLSGYVIEAKFVGGLLKPPYEVLFESDPVSRWRKVFPGYFKPLPVEQRRNVLDRASKLAGIDTPSAGLFYHCFARVKGIDAVRARLDTFLNLYGFCRNMAMALAIVGLALVVGALLGTAHTGSLVSPGWCAAASFAGALGLLYRYLKFFRHYSTEVFISYGEVD